MNRGVVTGLTIMALGLGMIVTGVWMQSMHHDTEPTVISSDTPPPAPLTGDALFFQLLKASGVDTRGLDRSEGIAGAHQVCQQFDLVAQGFPTDTNPYHGDATTKLFVQAAVGAYCPQYTNQLHD